MFYHVRVPKKRIAMNVLVGTTPSVEREATNVRGDGGDIYLGMDRGDNMRSETTSHFIKDLDILEPYGNYFHYTKCVGVFGRIGEIGKKEER